MIAIIPARGGSKGIPNKNIKELFGKPLIAYTIQAALEAISISEVFVSTDDIEIAEIAKKYGAKIPFLRPTELAQDNSKAIDTYIYTVNRLNDEFNYKINSFIVLQPTSPLRSSDDIDEAVEQFMKEDPDSLVSLTEAIHPPIWAKKIRDQKIESYFEQSANLLNRQEIDKAYMPNGAIYIFKINVLIKTYSYYTKNSAAYIMPSERSIDIDSITDFEYVEYILNKKQYKAEIDKILSKNKVPISASIRDALKKLDEAGSGFIYANNKNGQIVGIMTDGDFRRLILSGISLDENIESKLNKNFISVNRNYTRKEIIDIFTSNRIDQILVIDRGKVVDVIPKSGLSFISDVKSQVVKPQVSIVIMAGGKGTRLKPFTNILPKALIPVGEKTMLEAIMDEYQTYFKSHFYISTNYKAEMIKIHLEQYRDHFKIDYIDEDVPLGTAGSLKYIRDGIKEPFFVSNCDILIKTNYQDILRTHKDKNNDITLVASLQHHQIPYGVCEIGNKGQLLKINEKPNLDFLVNAGMYVLNPETLKYIPEGFFHITELIEIVKQQGGQVGVYPVSEKSWIDVGQWGEYNKNINDFN